MFSLVYASTCQPKQQRRAKSSCVKIQCFVRQCCVLYMKFYIFSTSLLSMYG